MPTPAPPNVIEIPGLTRAAGRVTLDYMADDDLQQILIDGGLIRDHLITVIADADALVPEGTEWRIHVTGDMSTSVGEIDLEYSMTTYTVDRGANTVAGKTIRQSDGTFDVLISPVIWAFHDEGDPGKSAADMLARVRHTFMHEALHVAFYVRGEDTFTVLPSVEHLDRFEQPWSRHLGFMLEDYRIEVALASVAPVPQPWVSLIGNDLALFEAERARSHQLGTIQGDFAGGLDVMTKAATDMTRCLAYLAAETDDPALDLVGVDLERWDRFIAPTWDEWLATYRLAEPGTEEMTSAAIIAVIERLSVLGPQFLESVGFVRNAAPSGDEQVWWLRDFEW